MIGPGLDATTFAMLEKVAAFTERRHEVLAGNVANIDTPDYRMRDLPVDAFQDALGKAMQHGRQPRSLGSVSPTPSQTELFPSHLFRAVEAEPQNITFHDANNRSIEHQMMELTKNSMLQQYAMQIMTAQFNQLQTVISERP